MKHLIEHALQIALAAHSGQVDKIGEAYILHPINVMINLGEFSSDEAKCVALLHDVIEDSAFVVEDLEEAGFTPEIIEAVLLLTKQRGQSYDDYLAAIRENELARIVKLADLKHNTSPYRIVCETEKDIARQAKYRKAIAFLNWSE